MKSNVPLALLAAPLASASAFCLFTGAYHLAFFLYVFVLSIPHVLILGLPLYWACKGNGWTQWWVSIIAGFLIGSIPLSVVYLFGNKDISFLLFMSNVFIPLGILGAIGGYAAWIVWKLTLRTTPL